MTDGKKIIEQAKEKVKKDKKEMKKLSTKNAVIISIISTLVVTAGLIFAGYKVYEFIYNKGVSDANARHSSVIEDVTKTVSQLKEVQQ